MSRQIIRNAAICVNCGTVLVSRHTHDFVSCKCGCFVDGGTSYVRYGGPDHLIPLTLYADDPHEKIRKYYEWGTRGKDGKQPLTYVKLKDLTWPHICDIIKTQTGMSLQGLNIFINELSYRKQHEQQKN